MTDYSRQLEQIKAARSLDELRVIANTFPANAQGKNGILYSGWIGEVHSEVIAKELSRKTGTPIINDTARAQFLSAKSVEKGIHESAQKIFMDLGENLAQAKQSAEYFIYGNGRAPAESSVSVQNSLWGQASREFVASVDGDVIVVASAANAERVLAQVEMTTALQSTRITTLAGHSLSFLQRVHVQGGTTATLSAVQTQFIDASTEGIFILPDNFGAAPGQVALSRELALALHFDGSKFAGARALSEAGFVRASLSPTQQVVALSPAADLVPRGHFSSRVVKGLGAGGVVAMTYDAYTTAEQYQELSAQGNQFGADTLLRRYEGRTAGGFIGGIGAGAAYGFVAGSETGPGAFITGAVGGVVGAFAGDKIATMVTEHKVNHQTGTDGVTYVFEHGRWQNTHYQLDPGGASVPNPYGAASMRAVVTPAPTEQLAQLDYQRMTAITALALANPAAQDTRHIELDGTRWHATADGWAQQMQIPGVPNTYGIPSLITVDKPAEARTVEALNQIAANRQFNNEHYTEDVAKAYVMDYYGKDWGATGPLPDVVTKALALPSEERIKDPQTGHVWRATSDGHFTREEAILLDKMVVHEPVQATREEQTRLRELQQSAADANAAYGEQLIARKFEKWHASRQVEPVDRTATERSSASNTAITSASSTREMFDALTSAAGRMDIEAMRKIGQSYLQSDQGQAWLVQGHQFNQQQPQFQQQATADTRPQVGMAR